MKEFGFDFYLVSNREAVWKENKNFECIPQVTVRLKVLGII